MHLLFVGCGIMACIKGIVRESSGDQYGKQQISTRGARSTTIFGAILECDRVSLQWYGKSNHSQQRFFFRGRGAGRHRQILR